MSGGSSTSETKIPAWVEDVAKENLGRAKYASKIGYRPYYGPDVAAFTPMQENAFRGIGRSAEAFGMGPSDPYASRTWATDGIQPAKTYEGGFRGYSSGDLFDAIMKEFEARRPGQAAAINDMFIDPMTGAAPRVDFSPEGSVSVGAGSGAADMNFGSSSDSDQQAANLNGMSYEQLKNLEAKLQQYPALAPAGLLAAIGAKLAGWGADQAYKSYGDVGGLLMHNYGSDNSTPMGSFAPGKGWDSNDSLKSVQNDIDNSGYGYNYWD